MKQAADKYTRDAFDKPRPGRPARPDAKTPAQRAREYRERKRVIRCNTVDCDLYDILDTSDI